MRTCRTPEKVGAPSLCRPHAGGAPAAPGARAASSSIAAVGVGTTASSLDTSDAPSAGDNSSQLPTAAPDRLAQ